MLDVNNVTKQYANYTALNAVSLHVPEQSIYGLLGPNGAGKTTLIRIINAITAPDSGEVLLHNKRITPAEARFLGYLPEERGLYKKMKVGEQALYLARLKGMSKQDALTALKYWFEKFEIETWWNKKIEELSKGMAQKIQFITTILHQPEMLILDEPFSGLDPVNAELIKKEILALKEKGTTIIISTHNMASVEELCENISLINKANIVLQGNVDEIRAKNTTNTFKICTHGLLASPINNITITESSKVGKLNQYILRKSEELTNNELLALITPLCDIVTFEEILPTMNEIFIKTVKQ